VQAAELSDDALAALLQQHLQLDPTFYLSAAQQTHQKATTSSSNSKPSARSKTTGSKAATAAAAAGSSVRYESVDAFVSQMSKLLDMEREAEVAAAQEAATQCSTAVAQVQLMRLLCCLLSASPCCMGSWQEY
jgi:hypothetical protein